MWHVSGYNASAGGPTDARRHSPLHRLPDGFAATAVAQQPPAQPKPKPAAQQQPAPQKPAAQAAASAKPTVAGTWAMENR